MRRNPSTREPIRFASPPGGNIAGVNVSKVFRKRYRTRRSGIDAAADVNVTVAANVGRAGQRTTVSSRQRATAGPDVPDTETDPTDRNRARSDDDDTGRR